MLGREGIWEIRREKDMCEGVEIREGMMELGREGKGGVKGEGQGFEKAGVGGLLILSEQKSCLYRPAGTHCFYRTGSPLLFIRPCICAVQISRPNFCTCSLT
jgi:hypothetical protein